MTKEKITMNKKLSIEGMSCQHCVMHVSNALKEVAGVTEVEVKLADNSAVLSADGSVTDESIKEAVADAGYEVTNIEEI